MTYKSQNNEVEYILKYFGEYVGTLLSIGEGDGVTFSNSYDLIEKGWRATLVEPIKANFDKIPTPDGVQKFNFAIGTRTCIADFNIVEDGLLNSIYMDNAARYGLAVQVLPIPMFTYEDALQQFTHKKFDFITIDAEGMDTAILLQIDLSNVKYLCIEYGSDEQLIKRYCKGFRTLHRNGENLILVR